ncbi:MAG: hypothetical protein KBG42_07640 [Lachnospiraceae bacterium]|nr:hypothetical protein [Lachnospiraceae bacterium]
MSEFFPNIPEIKFEGKESKNPLAFKYYDAKKVIMGKTIDETTHQAYKSQIDLDQYISNNGGEIVPLTTGFDSVPDSSVSAVVSEKTESGSTVYVLTVKATAAGETYIITAEYTGNASAGYDRK